MGDLFENFKKWFDNPENDKHWEEIIKCDLEFKKRWINKFHNTSPEYRSEFIQKCIDKYESEEYRNKEYSKGYEPRCLLYYWILRYAEEYGEEITYLNDLFLTECYQIDKTWNIKLFCGQGSFIRIDKITE